jgi:putative spermidine/putrescine transport system substrate-binding protein
LAEGGSKTSVRIVSCPATRRIVHGYRSPLSLEEETNVGSIKAKAATLLLPVALAACSGTAASPSSGSSGAPPTPAAVSQAPSTGASGEPSAAAGGGPLTPDQAKGGHLTIEGWGGVWTDTTKAFADEFAKEYGVTIDHPSAPDPGAAAHLQVQSGAVQIDVIDSAAYTNFTAGDLAPFPSWLVDTIRANVPEQCVSDVFVGCYGDTATVIGCNSDMIAKCPTNAKEFWDVANFPGPRAITGTAPPDAQLIFGLLAAGVPKDQLYPIDIDKAIASLQVIKPNVTVWPTSGGQMQQTLVDGEVGIEYAWNGRIFNAMKEKPAIQMFWDDSTVAGGKQAGLAVPKGAPNADLAFTFLNWWSQQPELQAKWTESLTYPTPHKDVPGLLPKEISNGLPYSPSHAQPILVDAEYTAEHQEELQKAWQEFLTGS